MATYIRSSYLCLRSYTSEDAFVTLLNPVFCETNPTVFKFENVVSDQVI